MGDLERWSSRIARVDDDGIEDICNVAANYGGLSRTQAADACEFLKYRKDKVYEFVLKSRARFPKVEQWGLT